MKLFNRLETLAQIYRNMGSRYFIFRASYEMKRKLRILKKKFPTTYQETCFIDLAEWRKKNNQTFFFNDKYQLKLLKNPKLDLKRDYNNYLEGKILFFNAEYLNLGIDYDWITNPSNGYKYDTTKHWTEIEDIDLEAGDIKYVWEKSKFSFLYTLIRYDFHNDADCSELVLNEILDWIDKNPLNQGPNYKCSQEISIRIFNWTFALHYYKDAIKLDQTTFDKILNSIYWQAHHVFENINFSRIAVRNNHAITECLLLYLVGMLYPFFPESQKWKEKGKVWFEEEIQYQIYPDGVHLLFSHNYQRVVLQLMAWGCYLSEINGDKFQNTTYERIYASVNYLFQNTCQENGWLPNYGANDGALFFDLSSNHYRDYRGILNLLHYYFTREYLFENLESLEDTLWCNSNLNNNSPLKFKPLKYQTINNFKIGGVATFREENSFTFFKCTKYKHRPVQADNLHLDIWHNGENLLRDSGTYKYNTDSSFIRFFTGGLGHNSIMLGTFDQMKKGPRFIWLNWGTASEIKIVENSNFIEMQASIKAFLELGENIEHYRIIRKYKGKPHWEVFDKITYDGDESIRQIWNINNISNNLQITSRDSNKILQPHNYDGWYSSSYGIKERSEQIIFTTKEKEIFTTIKVIE